mmetsp:Transcript_28147/g.57693  ORF Transcript_28147/g.57693 Transcript_28147/m.57693 type:complete len:965 (+) Transcript_28147:104-2998(+)
MVRTKKHFRPPSPSSSSSSSSDDDDDSDHQQPPIVGAARGGGKQLRFPGGGKQLSMMAGGRPGGGKQLRMSTQGDSDKSDDSDDSSDDDDEEEEAPPKPTVTYGRPGGGKQFRVGGGKQLRAPQMDDDDDDSSSESSEDEEEEETKATQVYRPQFGGKAFNRGGGKQLRPPSPDAEEDDSSSSESEEEAPPPPVVVRRGQGGGKQLRPPTVANDDDDDDDSADDMEESEEEDEAYEEEEVKKAPEPEPEPPKQPEPEPEPESESEAEAEPETRRSQPTRASTRSTRSTKKVIDEESSDSESSSSSEEEQEWGMESFDTQKLVQSEADKEYLDSLPELEREAILAERFEKLKSEADMKKALRENKRKEREQKKSAKAQKGKSAAKKRGASTKSKAEPPKKKEKAEKKKIIDEEEEEEGEEVEHEEIEKNIAPDTSGDAALAESMSGKRVSTRNLDAKGDKFKKAAALAKIRENLATKAPTKDDSESDLDYGKDSDDSDDDDDYVETSVKPWQQTGRKSARIAASESDESVADNFDDRDDRGDDTQRRDIDADVEDYGKVTIPRRRLIRWCNEPYFEQAVTDFYVRLGIGRDMKTQKACYRLCKIVGVETKTEYSFPPVGNQKPISTNKWLQVTFGKHQTSFKMITVSDHRPSADDVAKYVSQLKTDRLRDDILLKKHANKLRKKQDELVTNYTYTKEDIENLIKDKKKRSKKASNIGLEKTRIGIAVQAARDAVEDAKRRIEDAKVERMEANDMQAMSKAEGDLKRAQEALEDAESNLVEKIEEQKRIHKDEQERINKMKKSSKIQNWVKVNQRAKLANQHADFQSYKEQRAKEQAAGSAEPKFNPYARRKVKPKNLWEVGGKDKKSENITDDGAQEEKKDSSHPSDRDDSNDVKDHDKEAKRDEVPETQKVEMPGQSNQYAFDDDIMTGGDITTIGLGVKKVKSRVRKGLSLDDYHEKKTAGTL